MSALQTARLTPKLANGDYNSYLAVPIKANAVLYLGALVCVDATGYLVPGATSTTLRAVGCMANWGQYVPGPVLVGGSVNGAKQANVSVGTFKFANYDADAITQADLLRPAYIVDDQTVARGSGGSTRSVAGQIVGVDGPESVTGPGVWVAVGKTPADLVGAQGPTGPQGPIGPTGPQGPTGP